MPLKKGRSKKTISGNIGEMVRSYKATGRLGNSRPKSLGKAMKQAEAAAYRKAGRSRSK